MRKIPNLFENSPNLARHALKIITNPSSNSLTNLSHDKFQNHYQMDDSIPPFFMIDDIRFAMENLAESRRRAETEKSKAKKKYFRKPPTKTIF